MKRFLLWIIGVILGVVVLLGAVMAVSYSFTGEGSRPEAAAQFGGQELEVSGTCQQEPFTSSACPPNCVSAAGREPSLVKE